MNRTEKLGPCVLVTGGAGFIGSHTCVALIAAGYTPVILDNLSNSDVRVLERIESITGRPIDFVKGDVLDADVLDELFDAHRPVSVIHFAGLKAVGDSMSDPLQYYGTNVSGTLVLADAMLRAGVRRIIFSSSATVYGKPEHSPIPETAACRPSNPYGHSKQMVEQVLTDLHRSDASWQIVLLRYFNPVGAHESGMIGEHPRGKPNNLMPYVCQVAVGLRETLQIHGGDYETTDGTGVRDYVHVMDLAEGHVAALRHAESDCGLVTLNLGTGNGASVMEVVKAFEQASQRTIPHVIGPRRPGDIAAYWGDASLALATIGWKAKRNLVQMCEDSWRWQKTNPDGYSTMPPTSSLDAVT